MPEGGPQAESRCRQDAPHYSMGIDRRNPYNYLILKAHLRTMRLSGAPVGRDSGWPCTSSSRDASPGRPEAEDGPLLFERCQNLGGAVAAVIDLFPPTFLMREQINY